MFELFHDKSLKNFTAFKLIHELSFANFSHFFTIIREI